MHTQRGKTPPLSCPWRCESTRDGIKSAERHAQKNKKSGKKVVAKCGKTTNPIMSVEDDDKSRGKFAGRRKTSPSMTVLRSRSITHSHRTPAGGYRDRESKSKHQTKKRIKSKRKSR